MKFSFKIVSFSPGLGNQLFEYVFYQYLKQQFPKLKIYGYYNKRWLKYHNGLEIQNVFNIELPRSSYFINQVVRFFRFFRLISNSNRVFCSDENVNLNSVFFDGWWQDQKYFTSHLNKITFREFDLGLQNQNVLKQIADCKSVSIHIRRGDYVSSKYINIYGGICTVDYYASAIDIIRSRIEQPKFFIFSDDIQWVKENIKLDNSEYISWNTGASSFIDMYLMSNCKSSIIANSTFSYWASMLNIKKEIVIYPKAWVNPPAKVPNIHLESWIGI